MALLLENGADVNSRNYCGQVGDFSFILDNLVLGLLIFVGFVDFDVFIDDH